MKFGHDMDDECHQLLHDTVRMYKWLKFLQKLIRRIGRMLDKIIWEMEVRYGIGVKDGKH